MTAVRDLLDSFHSPKDRQPRLIGPLLISLLAMAIAPAAAFAGAAEDNYVPSAETGGGGGGDGGGGGPSLTPEDFAVQEPAEPRAAEPVPAAPAAPTVDPAAAEDAAEAQRRAAARAERLAEKRREARQQSRREAREEAEAMRLLEAAAEAEAARSGTALGPDGRTVARAAFKGDAGPLAFVIGLLLLVTGAGLIVRYRRMQDHGA